MWTTHCHPRTAAKRRARENITTSSRSKGGDIADFIKCEQSCVRPNNCDQYSPKPDTAVQI